MRYLTLLSTMLLLATSWAQLTDDFSDGNFTNNPTWSGDEDKFVVENETLRSNSAVASDLFYLSTPSTIAQDDLEWRFRVNMRFNTSGVNYTDVYLMADSSDLTRVVNGYFVRIGNTKDEVSLYKIQNGTETQLTDGADDKTHNKNISLKITKTAQGEWTVQADYAGGQNYQTEGNTTDNEITSTTHFGFLIAQSTASFHFKHFYDDIYVGPLIVDTIKPAITHTLALDKNTLRITTNEPVTTTGTTFTLNNGYGMPTSVENTGTTLTLTYTNDLVNGDYELTINQLGDLAGNRLDTVAKFNYFVLPKPQATELLITEILADQTPSVGLPSAEYVEIYNNSTRTLDLTNCTLSDGGTPASLPASSLAAGAYATLVKEGTEHLFSAYPNILAVRSFPTLNNAGDDLELKNETGIILDQVAYTDEWYRDSDKKKGGYSLERIDFESNCAAVYNWIASKAPTGGTPSAPNSVMGQNPDSAAPKILSYTLLNSTTVELTLNEQPITEDLSADNFTLQPNSEKPTYANYDIANTTLILSFATELQANRIYSLAIGKLEDCLGNTKTNITAQLITTTQPKKGDVLINELLFNPKTNGVDFIELYNTSKKYIDLSTLNVARYTDKRETVVAVAPNKQILYPNGYVALSIDSNKTKEAYSAAQNLVQLERLPAMNNGDGTVLLLDNGEAMLDSVPYTENQHFALLSDVKGVSLERINTTGQSHDPSTWHSASSTSGYATPGYQNSQFIDFTAPLGELSLPRKTFSPDGDGYEDLLVLSYAFESLGNVLNAYVYDLGGRLTHHAINNETLSTSGTLSWDGVLSNGTKIAIGNYILLAETFNLNGKTERKKFAFSVLGQF